MSTARRPVVPYAPWGVGVLLALAVVAFYPGYLARLDEPLDPYTHAHALAMTAWMLLLIVQPVLVDRGHRTLHRALGTGSILLVGVLVAAGMLLAHQRFSAKPEAEFEAVAYSFYLPVSTLVLFLIPFTLGLMYRRQRGVHGRFMLATVVSGMDPIFARLPYFALPSLAERTHALMSFALIDAIVLAVIWSERRERVGRWIFPLVLMLTLVQQVGFFTVARSDAFREFARWYRQLPLT